MPVTEKRVSSLERVGRFLEWEFTILDLPPPLSPSRGDRGRVIRKS